MKLKLTVPRTKSSEERKKCPIQFHTKEREIELLRKASNFAGLSLSGFVRRASLKEAREVEQLWQKTNAGEKMEDSK